MTRRSTLRWMASLAVWTSVPRVFAQAWPAHPIRLIVAAGPGSSLDTLARIIAERLKDRLGQPVIIDNRAAAGGTVAMDLVAKSTDGHTIGLGFNGPLAFAPFVYARLPYDPVKDLVPIILTSSQPNVLAVNAQLPVRTVPELIAYAKARPGQLNYASVGNASSSHLAMELFKSLTETYIVHIPFNGAPPATLSVAAGDTQMVMAVPTAINAHVQSGKVRLIATTGRVRYPLLPDLPTLAESAAALQSFEALAWNGIVGAPGMPGSVVDKLNAVINDTLREPDAQRRLANAGLQPVGGSTLAMRDFLAAEVRRWRPIIERTGARID